MNCTPAARYIYKIVFFVALLLLNRIARADRCQDLAKLALTNTTITTAEFVTSSTFKPEDGEPTVSNLPNFCRVLATLTPTPDSDIKVEVWLPLASAWNGSLVGTGNGGFAGTLTYGRTSRDLRKGYATANTDMGMAVPHGKNQSIFINHPERWADWGYRSTHEMTVFAKQLIKSYYEQETKHSYFEGCSTGGEQALMEAERYPDDYEGIVAGAPANYRTPLHIALVWNLAVTQSSASSWLPPEKIALLSKSVLDACDALDGVKDEILSDPEHCNFDPAVLLCKADDQPECLTKTQLETVKKLYTGPVNPRTGANIFPGMQKGSESGWSKFSPPIRPDAKPPYAPLFQWVFGADWNWHKFDFDHDVDTVNQRLAAALNATSPNLDSFRAHGHKLIAYHGWNDLVIAPESSVLYYNSVVAYEKAAHKFASVDNFYRLFMVPGMGHCNGGAGPDQFDPLSAVVQWVEQDIAPDLLVAGKNKPDPNTGKTMHRPLCPYPQIVKYNGTGDTNEAESFHCTLQEVKKNVTFRMKP
jgi:feruloyl esterase